MGCAWIDLVTPRCLALCTGDGSSGDEGAADSDVDEFERDNAYHYVEEGDADPAQDDSADDAEYYRQEVGEEPGEGAFPLGADGTPPQMRWWRWGCKRG